MQTKEKRFLLLLKNNFQEKKGKTLLDRESYLNLYSCQVPFSFLQLSTVLFTNRRILKFKSQPTIAFFAAVNHLNGPLRKQNFTLTSPKGHGL